MPLAVFQAVRGTGWISRASAMMSLWVNHKQGQSCDQFSLPWQTFNWCCFLWKTFKVAKRHVTCSWNEWYPNSASWEWMVPASRKLLSLADVADRSPALKAKPQWWQIWPGTVGQRPAQASLLEVLETTACQFPVPSLADKASECTAVYSAETKNMRLTCFVCTENTNQDYPNVGDCEVCLGHAVFPSTTDAGDDPHHSPLGISSGPTDTHPLFPWTRSGTPSSTAATWSCSWASSPSTRAWSTMTASPSLLTSLGPPGASSLCSEMAHGSKFIACLGVLAAHLKTSMPTSTAGHLHTVLITGTLEISPNNVVFFFFERFTYGVWLLF